ncbi:MAG TPA: deoxynucleoside kinase [Candidatus Acidoferrales bacterium]|nr:deoxynucleoside kinase [Candidatus Acidoferrales bacterium]
MIEPVREQAKNPGFTPPRYIAIEGPIRVGKSTLAKVLAEQIHARRVFDCEDNPFLSDFYKERPGAAFRAQMYFLFERYRRLTEADHQPHQAPLVTDFLFEKDKIFAYINLDNEELKLYERYFDSFAPSVPGPDLVIYLQAKPDVLRKRVSKKGHPAEKEISPDYLQAVASAYEHFFFRYSASNLLVVDTTEIDFVERSQDLQELLRRLRQPVKGTQYFLPLCESG